MRRFLCFAAAFVLASAAGAQHTTTKGPTYGRVIGKIMDASTGQIITDAGIKVIGVDSQRVRSGVDGSYVIRRVPTGPLTLQITRIGYQPKSITGLYLNDNQTLEQNVSLDIAVMQAIVIDAAKENATVSAAVDQQRTSTGIVNSTTAEAIAKSPDGNAAQAVQRVSGITLGENSSVIARGLGDKYVLSSLNGARIPSPEPETRVVPLDLFPSGLLQSITTAKTFTPDLPGDFAGALVDIKTKEFPARRMWSAQIGQGYSQGATGARLIAGQTAGGERFGMGSGNRGLPEQLRYVGNFEGLNLTQGDQNLLISQFRNAWTPKTESALPNASGSVSFGGNDPVLFGHSVGYLFSGTFSASTDLKDHQKRALATPGNTKGEALPLDEFEGQTVSQGVLWGGLTNLSTLLGASSRLSLNAMYNRTADNDARIERGHFENEGLDVQVTRMQYVERAVRSLQLTGEHQRGNHRFDWAGTLSGVRRDEPDRSEFNQAIERDTPNGPERLRWMTNNGAIRTFSALKENNKEARGTYQLSFGPEGRPHSLKVGGLYRTTNRDADSREYSIFSTHMPTEIRELSAEQLFDGRFTGPSDSLFGIAPLAQGGSYTAHDRLTAGYAMTEFGIGFNVRVIAGARFENDQVRVNAKSTLGTPVTINKDWSDILPAVTVNIQLSEAQQLRFAASQTLARPEYRELTPIASREVLNGETVIGNDNLERARIWNADIRWESYRSAGELLSLAVFAKKFDSPIERVYRAASQGHSVFFTNADGAHNYGIEVEWRRDLGTFAQRLAPLSLFTNVTVMKSSITLSPDAEASATNLTRAMVGQAPYVFNSGLTYSSMSGGTTATLLVNRIGERVEAAGEVPLPDVVRAARTGLDFSLRFPIAGPWTGRVDAKNLLDAPFRTMQGRVVREEYRIGRVLQAGVTWKP